MLPLWTHIAVLVALAALIHHHVPQPYMDEIFHIPQAQQYCNGHFDVWDPKLTTPPGLYLASALFSWLSCSVPALRAVNLVFSAATYIVISRILAALHRAHSHLWLHALALVWFPVSFFYNFVYYTDAGSTLFVLLAYLFVKQKHYACSALAGIVSMFFRQTNVVWVVYFAGLSAIDILSSVSVSKKQDSTLYNPKCSDITHWRQITQSVASVGWLAVKYLPLIVRRLFIFGLAIVGFAAFLMWNNGIVLGDRSNHLAGFHFPQLLYFTSFLSFFASPWTFQWSAVSQVARSLTDANSARRWTFVVSILAFMAVLVRKFTYEHPFLLSDNRHYSFYVWKKIYRRHWSVRYVLLPNYVASGWLNAYALANQVTLLFSLGYLITLVLTLVPSPLLEFRYFILPFLFYAVHIPPSSTATRTLLALIFYAAINALTLHLFLYHPFTWASEPSQLQRFMW